MEKNYKILTKFIKDISVETKDAQTYLFVKENIRDYHLKISINSKAIKNKMIEIDTGLIFEDKKANEFRSNFEMTYTTVIKLNEEIKDKTVLQKIVLCDVQKEIYPEIEKALLNLLHTSGYPDIKFEKKIDFENLYMEKFN